MNYMVSQLRWPAICAGRVALKQQDSHLEHSHVATTLELPMVGASVAVDSWQQCPVVDSPDATGEHDPVESILLSYNPVLPKEFSNS